MKLASGWGSAFWCATKVNADGYYEAYDWCNDDCPNPETNINYAYESSQIYWTYEKESKTIRNQKCKYVHTSSHEFLLKTKKTIKIERLKYLINKQPHSARLLDISCHISRIYLVYFFKEIYV